MAEERDFPQICIRAIQHTLTVHDRVALEALRAELDAITVRGRASRISRPEGRVRDQLGLPNTKLSNAASRSLRSPGSGKRWP